MGTDADSTESPDCLRGRQCTEEIGRHEVARPYPRPEILHQRERRVDAELTMLFGWRINDRDRLMKPKIHRQHFSILRADPECDQGTDAAITICVARSDGDARFFIQSNRVRDDCDRLP